MNKSIYGFSVRDIAEISIFCALAIVLDRFVKIPLGPTGGSINIAVAPLCVIALRHGWFKSFIAGGLVFGLISCLFDGYGLICYPLEYLVAFGSICILGYTSKYINSLGLSSKKNILISYSLLIVSILLSTTVRFFAASIDSVLIWKYTFGAAFAYNLTYVFPSGLFVCIVVAVLLPAIIKINKIMPTSYLNNN